MTNGGVGGTLKEKRAVYTSNADKLFGLSGHQFFLIQTCPAAFDTVQIIVYLVRAIESNINERVGRQAVEFHDL